MDKKRAFVSGSTGFVGLALIEELLRQDWDVCALHRRDSNLRYLKRFPVKRAEGDILDVESLRRGMPENVDAVFHVAGSVSLWSRGNEAQDRINIDGTRNMADVVLERNAQKFVHTSTISVFGLQKGKVDENSERLGRVSWINYQSSKYRAEDELRKSIDSGLDACFLNPGSIIGPYDTEGWAKFIKLVYHRKLPGIPSGSMSFCHVYEVAKAHVSAVSNGRRGENYLLGGADVSYLELVQTIAEVTERKLPSKATADWMLRYVARVNQWKSLFTGKAPDITPETVGMITRRMFCDCSKAQKELGYQPIGVETMVADSFNWLKYENLL